MLASQLLMFGFSLAVDLIPQPDPKVYKELQNYVGLKTDTVRAEYD